MPCIVTFESSNFDLAGEKKNPINPVHGVSLGEWLSALLVQNDVEVTDIGAEDWGWYFYATFYGKKYLVGFVALPSEERNKNPELIIQINKCRSFWELIKWIKTMGCLN